MSRLIAIGSGVLLLLSGLTTSVRAQVESRERVEAEATGQAAEADRRFKAGDFAGALPLYQAERASRAALGDLRYEAYALRAIGSCRAQLGDDDAAILAWRGAITLDARRDDPGYEGYDWLLIGQAHLRRGRLEDCLKAVESALPKLATAVDRDHEADARLTLVDALLRLDRPAEAAAHLPKIEALANALNDPRRRALGWLAASLAARATGDPARAAERASAARRAFQTLKSRVDQAASARAEGEALADLDRLDAAVGPLEEAARLHGELADFAALADDLTVLAAVQADAGDPAAAVKTAKRGVEARRRGDDPPGEIEALVALANFQGQAGDRAGSAATLTQAVALARREATAAPARLVRVLLLSAAVCRRDGQPAQAVALLDEAQRVADQADNGALRRLVAEARAGRDRP